MNKNKTDKGRQSKIRLFHDGSGSSLNLVEKFDSYGYEINEKITGFSKPIVDFSGYRLIGHPQINTFFFSKEPK